MDIEILKNMLADFKANGIRNSGKTGLEKVIAYQDLIGRSSYPEIRDAWKILDDFQKQLFVWACSCCLSYDSVYSIVMETVGKDAKGKMYKQLESEYAALNEKEMEIGRRHIEVEKKEKELETVRAAHNKIIQIINESKGISS